MFTQKTVSASTVTFGASLLLTGLIVCVAPVALPAIGL